MFTSTGWIVIIVLAVMGLGVFVIRSWPKIMKWMIGEK